MKKKYKVFLMIGFFFIILAVFPTQSVTNLENRDKNSLSSSNNHSELPTETSDISTNPFKQQIFKEIDLELDIFGYKVCPTDEIPIERDETGIIYLKQNKINTINVQLNLAFGNFNFKSVPVKKEIIFDPVEEYLIRYEIEDPIQNFFMQICCKLDYTWFNLAFDNGDYQFNYDGILVQGVDDFGLYVDINPLIYNTDGIFLPNDNIGINQLKQCIEFWQQNSLQIDNKRYLERIDSVSSRGFSFTEYGLVHENWCKQLNWEGWIQHAAQLPSYWITHTSVDIGVRRYHGTIAQVKSDLQYYNRDYYDGGAGGYIRDTLIYEMICHGGTQYGHDYWDIYVWNGENYENEGEIVWDEIHDLWGHYYNPTTGEIIDIYPTDTIVFADLCYGYCDYDEHMVWYWIDDGAECFVGATISIPLYEYGDRVNDRYVWAFWEELCENGGTIRSATIALCEEYGHGWNLGIEWRIKGNQYATKP